MAPSYHKKIRHILKEADLPKDLSEDLKKELESHFYEKEHDLRFEGLKSEEIEKQLSEDFGNGELVAKHLNFVHKKSFYSFIKTLMKNENKPSIFITIFLFILLLFLYQNTLSDMHTSVLVGEISQQYGDYGYTSDLENHFKILILGLILVCSFTLSVRLYRGKALSQKIVSGLMFIVICIQIGMTYSMATSYAIFQSSYGPADTSDAELLEHPEKYYEWDREPGFLNYSNFKYGYDIPLPQSYVAYIKDGTFRFPKDLKGDEGVMAFGPPYASDDELINISIFDKENSPDKLPEMTWLDYYLKNVNSNELNHMQEGLLEDPMPNSSVGIPLPDPTAKMWSLKLDNSKKLRKDILLIEKNDRLYQFLYNVKNPVHHAIFFEMGSPRIRLPESEIEWAIYDNPKCPYKLTLPSPWMAYKTKEDPNAESFFGGGGFPEEFIASKDFKDCNFEGFKSPDTYESIEIKQINNQTLADYFKSKNYSVLQQGETEWQGYKAKRILLALNNDYDGKLIDSGVRATAFAIQIKENEWLIFSYNTLAVPRSELEEKNSFPQKIINSIVIKK